MRKPFVLPALAVSMGLFTMSSLAHAEERITIARADLPYCIYESWVVSQNGSGIQVTGYTWGMGWNGGACNGDPAPEYSISMDALLAFKDPRTGQMRNCKQLTPSTNPQFGIYNTTDGLGIYFATIPGAGLFSSGSAGLIIPSNELCGPGYYQIEMTAWTPNSDGQTWIGGPVHSDWQYMNIPNL
jgi:hypothetical protein